MHIKKLAVVFVLAVCIAGAAYAQEFSVTGEVKTGIFWYQTQHGKTKPESGGFIHNSEDNAFGDRSYSGLKEQQGRFRLNMQLTKDNIGMKTRLETTTWFDPIVKWGYAFAYGNFFDDQLKISAGKMGDSPWGSGGPEMWKELDTAIGMRFEYMPSFLPGLNVGFVLNDTATEPIMGAPSRSLIDVLMESVLGLSYTHDLFLVHFAYRLDSEYDIDVGDTMLFRLEERILQKYLPNFQIWVNGWYTNLNTGVKNNSNLINWLYVQYDPAWGTAQIRFGYDYYETLQMFYVRPSYYHKFFNNFLIVGTAFEFGQDFGEGKLDTNTPYLRWFIEPMVKLNFGNANLALAYRYKSDYEDWNPTDSNKKVLSTTNLLNLRIAFTF